MTANLQPPSPPSAPPAGDRLGSWKEIASYLGRGVRTVRRWEKEEGLPVHRHLHRKLSSVYAYKSEVEVWWQSRRERVETQAEGRGRVPERASPLRPSGFGGRASRQKMAVLVAGLAALALVTAGYLFWRGDSSPAAPASRVMLAVLPFENLSGDVEQAYLSDGVTEDLITELGRMQDARMGIIARTSVMQYRGTQKPIRQIASELGVGYVVEGSVQRDGERLRVTAQLIRAGDQTHLWAQRYDPPPGDLLRVQGEIAATIARQVAVKLPAARRPVPDVDWEAHDAVLRGRYRMESRTEEGIREALRQFERATKIDPRYAPAYAGLAEAYALLPTYTPMPTSEGMSLARRAARQTIQLDDSLPAGHSILGVVLGEYDWDWTGAEREFRRAIDLNANDANAHKAYAELLSYVGRFADSIAEARLARELDPASPVSNAMLGTIYYRARQYDRAIEALLRATEMWPDHPLAYLPLGLAYGQKQMHAEAIAALEKGLELSSDNPEYAAQLAGAHARAGHIPQARSMLRELEQRSRAEYISPFDYAVVYSSLGEHRRALDWLEQGYRERMWLLCVLKSEPIFDPLHDETRYLKLVHRMNFPPAAAAGS